MLNSGADINVRDRWGATPLENAIVAGHATLADYLFSMGGRLDAKRAAQMLNEAVPTGNLVLVERLLACGSDTDCADYDGRTPLHTAVANNNFLVAKCGPEHPVPAPLEPGSLD